MRARLMSKFIEDEGYDVSDYQKESLSRLNGVTITSSADHDNRVNILHKEHPPYDTTKRDSKTGDIVPCKKEYAYGHIIAKNGKLHLSERVTTNRDVMEHNVVKNVYLSLTSEEICDDIDNRHAKLVTDENVDFIVNRILSVCPATKSGY